MKTQDFLSTFAHLADAPGGVDRLRELILQLAVRGKLVEQDPEDEPASELLERISKEKQRLYKEKKISKPKKWKSINSEEIPFVVPTTWRWTRLDSLCSYIQRGKSPSYVRESEIPVISQKCVQWSGFKADIVRFIDPKTLDKYHSQRFLQTGDLLWNSTGTGTVGRVNVFFSDFLPYRQVVADSHVTVVRPFLVTPQYIQRWLASPNVYGLIDDVATGSTNQIELNKGTAQKQLVPLPPLAEQKRIVARVDELMELCDELETHKSARAEIHGELHASALNQLTSAEDATDFAKNWARIHDNFDLLFDTRESIDALRQATLELAVRGKLVEQDSADEPAEVLLERIEAEKKRFYQTGEFGKPAKVKSVGDEEKPFDIPRKWKWVRFAQLGELGRGRSRHRPRNDSSLYKDGTVPLVQTGEVARANKYVNEYHSLYNEKGVEQSKIWPVGTLCITIAANIGECAILGMDACFPDSIVGFVPASTPASVKYMFYFLRTIQSDLERLAPSTAQKNINLTTLNELVVPLPPEHEMKAITTRLDDFMALCDDLENLLLHRNAKTKRFAEAVVHSATVNEFEGDAKSAEGGGKETAQAEMAL